jgi:preprotein translocase subunit SecA
MEYDDVNMSSAPDYEQRRKVLDGEDVRESMQGMIAEVVGNTLETIAGERGASGELLRPWEKLFCAGGEIRYSTT